MIICSDFSSSQSRPQSSLKHMCSFLCFCNSGCKPVCPPHLLLYLTVTGICAAAGAEVVTGALVVCSPLWGLYAPAPVTPQGVPRLRLPSHVTSPGCRHLFVPSQVAAAADLRALWLQEGRHPGSRHESTELFLKTTQFYTLGLYQYI